MEKVELTKLTSKGYVRIPRDIRKSLKLDPNTRFVIFSVDDTLTLKKIETPGIEDFEELTDWGTKFAKEKGIKEEDVIKND